MGNLVRGVLLFMSYAEVSVRCASSCFLAASSPCGQLAPERSRMGWLFSSYSTASTASVCNMVPCRGGPALLVCDSTCLFFFLVWEWRLRQRAQAVRKEGR